MLKFTCTGAELNQQHLANHASQPQAFVVHYGCSSKVELLRLIFAIAVTWTLSGWVWLYRARTGTHVWGGAGDGEI